MTEDDRGHKTERPRRARPSPAAPGTVRRAAPGRSPWPRVPPAESSDRAWLLVGQVVGVFGIRGAVKVRPETDFPERFTRSPKLYLGVDRAPMAVVSARLDRGQAVLQLEGVDDVETAERLRGVRLYVPASEAVALPPDTFYLHDVIGLRAERPDGTVLGLIADVYTGTGQDVFAVRDAATGREVLVPAVKEMVKRVDIAGGVVVIEPVAGLFDERFETAE